jgi:hypothetical protein
MTLELDILEIMSEMSCKYCNMGLKKDRQDELERWCEKSRNIPQSWTRGQPTCYEKEEGHLDWLHLK